MKRIFTSLLFVIAFILQSKAQVKLDDFGRIVLNTYLPDNLGIPAEAKQLLETKLTQMTSDNGMGGSQANPRFVITAKVNVVSKDIIPGAPQMVAQNVDVTLLIGDAITSTIFSNITISIKGVGTNENKAFIEAFKTINTQQKDVKSFLDQGKNKIINYYSTNCDFLIKDANALAKQGKYDEALYSLMTIPNLCEECYLKCHKTAYEIYTEKINNESKLKLQQAKITWSTDPTLNGAKEVASILGIIDSKVVNINEINTFLKEVRNKLTDDQNKSFEFEIKKQDNLIELQKLQLETCKQISFEFAKNQPKLATYNNIFWK